MILETFTFPETVVYALVSWCVMLLMFFLARRYRRLHVAVMSSIITLDFLFPFYLYLTRDWGRRLFDEGDILSFMLWTHLLLVITMYVLYVVQIQAGRRLLRGEGQERSGLRSEHRGLGIAILVARGLVVFTGALLVESHYEAAPSFGLMLGACGQAAPGVFFETRSRCAPTVSKKSSGTASKIC
ncbi:MAG: hypothetical protein LBV36_08140 [Chromatiales bacterium]|nr:hypothetical protein [Chromatiales bacterium]